MTTISPTSLFVRCTALSKSGVDYMEFGYRSSRELYPPEDYGAWKYCDDDKIKKVIDGIEPDLVEALDQLAKTPVDVVYVVDSFGALYCEQMREAQE